MSRSSSVSTWPDVKTLWSLDMTRAACSGGKTKRSSCPSRVDQEIESLLILGKNGITGTLGNGGEELHGPLLFFGLGLFPLVRRAQLIDELTATKNQPLAMLARTSASGSVNSSPMARSESSIHKPAKTA